MYIKKTKSNKLDLSVYYGHLQDMNINKYQGK